jgi:hypothetical protein
VFRMRKGFRWRVIEHRETGGIEGSLGAPNNGARHHPLVPFHAEGGYLCAEGDAEGLLQLLSCSWRHNLFTCFRTKVSPNKNIA